MKKIEPLTAEARLMRQVPSAAEAALWQLVRGRGFQGLKFRRMELVGGQMAALLNKEARVILDLRPNPLSSANDTARLAVFRNAGWRVLSITEAEVLADPAAALNRLLQEAS